MRLLRPPHPAVHLLAQRGAAVPPGRVSGPLLDRIDLCVEMDPIAFDELHTAAPAESSADLRKQVLAARAIQAKRYAAPGYEGWHCNAQLNAGRCGASAA